MALDRAGVLHSLWKSLVPFVPTKDGIFSLPALMRFWSLSIPVNHRAVCAF